MAEEASAEKRNQIENDTAEIIHTELFESLAKIVSESRVSDETLERRLYGHDLAPLPKMMEMGFKMLPDAVVRPKTALEVSRIIKLAVEKQLPVIPRGGASWALGGAVPVMGGIVLDLATMSSIIEIDEENLTVTVEPGITWADLYRALLRKGYLIGAYPSSALAATVGGWINTGGVGVGSYKYGGVEKQILALEMVLPKGEIITFGSPNVKSGSFGDNLRLFFTGSEGTLGIITKVTLRIYPAPEEIRPIAYTFLNTKDMCEAISDITRSTITPLHISFFDKNHFDFLRQMGKETPEIDSMIVLALEGTKVSLDHEEAALDIIARRHGGEKQDKKLSNHEWEERFFEMRVKRLGPTIVLAEGMIPVSKMHEMITGSSKVIKRMKLRAAITGMVSDRNTVTFMPYCLTDERKFRSMMTMSFIKKIGDLAFKAGGRPAGLGIFFASNLKKLHANGANVMVSVKSMMDPHDIMNPGKTTEGMTRFGIPIPAFGMNLGMNMMAFMKRLPGMRIKPKMKVIQNPHTE
ncbi:MAG: FAD-binding oxidoreductase [Methanomassiliicoccales archaeon]|nr:MAG: FAD-binding oxidoreductase [Methanomassiliicoccales archaeon]